MWTFFAATLNANIYAVPEMEINGFERPLCFCVSVLIVKTREKKPSLEKHFTPSGMFCFRRW